MPFRAHDSEPGRSQHYGRSQGIAASASSEGLSLLADWDEDRNGPHCALVQAIEEMPRRDEFISLLRETCAHFEHDVVGVINVPEVPDVAGTS